MPAAFPALLSRLRASRPLSALRRRLAHESGFTLIELLIALVVLVVGVLGLLMTFNTSRKLSLVSERHASMTHIAQKEIERIEGIRYSQIGLTTAPSSSTNTADPGYYVTAGSPPTFKWDRAAGSSETLVIDPTYGTVLAVQSWSEGQLSGSVYDFVTWTTDPKCAPGCPASSNYKRITVAVTMGGGLRPNPVYVSSVVADPQAAPAGGVKNGSGGNPLTNPATTCKDGSGTAVPCISPINSGNPNTFFLHDWHATGSGAPPPPSVDHATHPTVGALAGLLCTPLPLLAGILSNILGCPVPDLMDGNPPPPTTGSPITTPLYHYSTDLGTTTYPGGALIQPTGAGTGSAGDCSNGNWASNLLNIQSHFWVSSPLTATTTLTGEGGMSVFTQTGGGVNAVVSYCVEIYDVPPSGGAGLLTDLLAWPPVALGGAAYIPQTDPATGGNWPTSAAQLSFIFNFRGSSGTVSIAPGHRLGVRVWMKATLNAAIALIFDHPLYPAQLQLNSQ